MKHINELATSKPLTNPSTGKQLATGADLSERDVVLIDRFYAQVREIYGHKFTSLFDDPEALDRNKRVWAPKIAEKSPEQLAVILDTIKTTGVPEWPDMSAILKTNTSISPNGFNAAAYKPYKHPAPPSATKVQKAEQKARGLQRLAMLRKSLEMPPLSEASQVTMVELEQIFDSVVDA